METAPETATPSPTKHVRVISLTTSNFKRIRAAHVAPDPSSSVVLIGGEIDNGKSSLLDSMLDVFGGANASPEVPVRKGMAKSETTIDLGDLVCRVRHTKSGGRELQIEDKDGNRLKRPQDVMDALTGKVGFDAEEFIRKKPDLQLDILRKIVGIDFGPLDAKKANLYTQRTAANTVVKTLETQLASAANPTDAPAALVDTAEVLAEIQKAQEHNKGREPLVEAYNKADSAHKEATRARDADQTAIQGTENAIKAIEEELRVAKETLDRQKQLLVNSEQAKATALAAWEAAVAAGKAFVSQDTSALQAKLAGADVQNNKFRQAEARRNLAASLKEAQSKATALDNAVQQVDADKETLLLAAKFPVKGLSFGEHGIMFEGVPFEQAASSTKRRVSVAIGAALNPTLRVCVIKDGALLGTKGIEQVRELASEFGIQVWIEVVTNSPADEERCTVVIEDGSVKGAEPVEEIPEVAEKSSTAAKAAEPPKDLFGSLPSQ